MLQVLQRLQLFSKTTIFDSYVVFYFQTLPNTYGPLQTTEGVVANIFIASFWGDQCSASVLRDDTDADYLFRKIFFSPNPYF